MSQQIRPQLWLILLYKIKIFRIFCHWFVEFLLLRDYCGENKTVQFNIENKKWLANVLFSMCELDIFVLFVFFSDLTQQVNRFVQYFFDQWNQQIKTDPKCVYFLFMDIINHISNYAVMLLILIMMCVYFILFRQNK